MRIHYNSIFFTTKKQNDDGIIAALDEILNAVLPVMTVSLLGQKHHDKVHSQFHSLQEIIDRSFEEKDYLFYDHRAKKKQKLSPEKTTQEKIDNIVSVVLQYCKSLTFAVSRPTERITAHAKTFLELHVMLGNLTCLLASCLLSAGHHNAVISLFEQNTMVSMFDAISKVYSDRTKEIKQVIAVSELQCAIALRIADTEGSDQLAFAHSTRSVEIYPGDYFPAILLSGLLAYEIGDMAKAQLYFKKCVEERKQYVPQSMNMLGCIYAEQKNQNLAIELFQQAIKAYSNENSDEKEALVPAYNTAIQYGKQRNYYAQHKMLQFLLNKVEKQPRVRSQSNDIMLPDVSEVLPTPIQIMYMIAQCTLKQQQYDVAVSSYQYIIDTLVNSTNVR
jgi:tetratricopeptide (TPR) repeat protein